MTDVFMRESMRRLYQKHDNSSLVSFCRCVGTCEIYVIKLGVGLHVSMQVAHQHSEM